MINMEKIPFYTLITFKLITGYGVPSNHLEVFFSHEELLKKNEVKATFFVVGTKAEKYPELIQRMHNEGHLMGIHNYVHHSNWFMSPWKV